MLIFIFFFQAEDGIRDDLVTGVQTCALPILLAALPALCHLLAGGVGWRGETVPAGGAFGSVIAGLLDERLSFTGSLLVLASAALIGAALVGQSALRQVLASWPLNPPPMWHGPHPAPAPPRVRPAQERARRPA